MDDEKFECLDALRDPIVLGNLYGWSSTKSGWSRTTVGKAKSISKKGSITLEVVIVHNFLYGKQHELLWPAAKAPARGSSSGWGSSA